MLVMRKFSGLSEPDHASDASPGELIGYDEEQDHSTLGRKKAKNIFGTALLESVIRVIARCAFCFTEHSARSAVLMAPRSMAQDLS